MTLVQTHTRCTCGHLLQPPPFARAATLGSHPVTCRTCGEWHAHVRFWEEVTERWVPSSRFLEPEDVWR